MVMRLNIFLDGGLLLAYCTMIFFLSSRTVLPLPALFPHADKLIHALAYAMMGVLAWRYLLHTTYRNKRQVFISVTFCSLYGVSDEWHQSFVEGRDSDALDWAADTTGALLAVLIVQYLYTRYQQRLATRVS